MGRRLPDEVVHRIRLRIEANEDVANIAAAVKVAKKTIYKMQTLTFGPNHTLLLLLSWTTESSAALPGNSDILRHGVELFADWFYRGFLASLKTSLPHIWMRCRPSYLTSLTPKLVFQLSAIFLRGVVGRERQLQLVRLRGVAPFVTPGLVSKRAGRRSNWYFLTSQQQTRGLVIGSTVGH